MQVLSDETIQLLRRPEVQAALDLLRLQPSIEFVQVNVNGTPFIVRKV